MRPVGTRRVYRIDPAGLGALRRWLDEQWERALGEFKATVEDHHDRRAAHRACADPQDPAPPRRSRQMARSLS
ncbi:MAG: hypothetical protein WDN44_05120 [Sphingomonas sp.]